MGNLTFHRNIDEITDPSLIPEETRSYRPLPNEQFINMVEKMVGDANFSITDRKFKTNKKKSQLFGVFTLNDKGLSGLSTSIGMINSYDKSRSAALAIGANVHRCSNLSFSSFKQFRMHKGKNFWKDIDKILDQARIHLHKAKEPIQKRYDALDELRLTDNDRDWAIGHLLCNDVIGANQVSQMKKTLTGEEDYIFGTETWYDLNMHMTEVLKSSHPYSIVDDHMQAEHHLIGMAKVKVKSMRKKGVIQSNVNDVLNNLTSPLEGEDDIFMN